MITGVAGCCNEGAADGCDIAPAADDGLGSAGAADTTGDGTVGASTPVRKQRSQSSPAGLRVARGFG